MAAGIIAAAAAAPIIGGLIGQHQASGDRRLQKQYMEKALAEIRKLAPPDPEDQKVFFEELKRQGYLTPELEEAVQVGPTALENIQVDPRLREAQMRSLAKLQELGEGGLNLEDKAALNQIQSENAARARGAREAILSNARQRGVASGGNELAAQLIAEQSSANRNAQQGLDVAAQAQRRALEAIMNSGQFASGLRAQEYGEQSDLAKARDQITQFNAGLRQGVSGRNVDRNNNAQEYNLSEDQRIADANVGTRNTQNHHNNVGVYDTAYEREVEKARLAAAALGGTSGFHGQQATNTQQMWGGIGQGVGQGFSAYNSNKPKKEEYE